MTKPELTLKTTPPRLLRGATKRDRLLPFWTSARERSAILVTAPGGFGKTTVMLQWRRQWMEQDALVAWLSADLQDEPTRFTLTLLHAFGNASGKAVFDTLAAQCENKADQETAILTALLAEIALLGTETVLMLDDAEHLPEATVLTSLQYLLLNAPANLHVVIGSRVLLPLPMAELVAMGNLAVLKTEDLRFRLEESIDMLDRRLRHRLNVHQSAKLHDTVQGWPLGLQFAISRVEYEDDPARAAETFSARQGDLQSYFVDALITGLSAPEADFLVRIAILDYIQADLCVAVTGDAHAEALLDRFARETPLMTMGGHEGWGRLHPLARDFLLQRFEHLPQAEQLRLHGRASRWFAERERFHEAARHAQAAGDEVQAHAYAMRSLWMLGTQGKLTEAREWLACIPPRMLAQDVSLKLVAAWVFALSNRNKEALRTALRAAADPASTPQRRMVALRVAGGAAIYADHLGLVPELVAQWPQSAAEDPLYAAAPLNGSTIVALHSGLTGKAREFAAQVATCGDGGSMRLAAALSRTMVGLSHLWDGNAYQVELALRPALATAEKEEGRRGTIACTYASVLAAAMLQRGQPETAQTLLANRLDVIEEGFPDIVLTAYYTLVRIALDKGDEWRALATLDNLDALAKRRQLPRLQLYGLAERVRIHAVGGRAETVEQLVGALDRLATVFRRKVYLPFLPQYLLATAIAKAYAALARHHLDEAEHQLKSADAIAHQLRRSNDVQALKILRAVLAQQRGAIEAAALMSEAISLANLGGNVRLLVDTHPEAVRMAEELPPVAIGTQQITQDPEFPRPASPSSILPRTSLSVGHGLLTAKEAEVLLLLDKGMSNKQIARIMDISGETVKWHLKNLFKKLSAGTRKHAVGRARLLGLVDG